MPNIQTTSRQNKNGSCQLKNYTPQVGMNLY